MALQTRLPLHTTHAVRCWCRAAADLLSAVADDFALWNRALSASEAAGLAAAATALAPQPAVSLMTADLIRSGPGREAGALQVRCVLRQRAGSGASRPDAAWVARQPSSSILVLACPAAHTRLIGRRLVRSTSACPRMAASTSVTSQTCGASLSPTSCMRQAASSCACSRPCRSRPRCAVPAGLQRRRQRQQVGCCCVPSLPACHAVRLLPTTPRALPLQISWRTNATLRNFTLSFLAQHPSLLPRPAVQVGRPPACASQLARAPRMLTQSGACRTALQVGMNLGGVVYWQSQVSSSVRSFAMPQRALAELA